jgi:hypothetical protein
MTGAVRGFRKIQGNMRLRTASDGTDVCPSGGCNIAVNHGFPSWQA